MSEFQDFKRFGIQIFSSDFSIQNPDAFWINQRLNILDLKSRVFRCFSSHFRANVRISDAIPNLNHLIAKQLRTNQILNIFGIQIHNACALTRFGPFEYHTPHLIFIWIQILGVWFRIQMVNQLDTYDFICSLT